MISETGNQSDQFLSNKEKETAEINQVFDQNKTILKEIVDKLLQATSNPTKAKRLEQIASQLNNLYAMGRNKDALEIDDFVPLKDTTLSNFLTEDRFINTRKMLQSNDLLPILFDNAIATFLTKNDLSLQKQAQKYLRLLISQLDSIITAPDNAETEQDVNINADNININTENVDNSKKQKENIEESEKQLLEKQTKIINEVYEMPDGKETPNQIYDVFSSVVTIDGDRQKNKGHVYFYQLAILNNNYHLSNYEGAQLQKNLNCINALLVGIQKFEKVREDLGIGDTKEEIERSINQVLIKIQEYENFKKSQENSTIETQRETKVGFLKKLKNQFLSLLKGNKKSIKENIVPIETEKQVAEEDIQRMLAEVFKVALENGTKPEWLDSEIFSTLQEAYNTEKEKEVEDSENQRKNLAKKIGRIFFSFLISKTPLGTPAILNEQREVLSDFRTKGIIYIRELFYGSGDFIDRNIKKTYYLERKVYEYTLDLNKRQKNFDIKIKKLGLDIDTVKIEAEKNGKSLLDCLYDIIKTKDFRKVTRSIHRELLTLSTITGFNHLDEEKDKYYNMLLLVTTSQHVEYKKDRSTIKNTKEVIYSMSEQTLNIQNKLLAKLLPLLSASTGIRSLLF